MRACPLVRFQISQQSTVPNASLPCSAARSRARHVVQNPRNLRRRRNTGRSAARSSRRIDLLVALVRAAARRTPQSADPATRSRCTTGLPVSRSHTIAVSRWLAMPIAATSRGSTLARASTSTAAVICDVSMSIGSCSTQPALSRPVWINLRELMLRDPRNPAVVIKEHRARTRRPLVQRQHIPRPISLRFSHPVFFHSHARRTGEPVTPPHSPLTLLDS